MLVRLLLGSGQVAIALMLLVAAWLPARAATAVDPIETLRSE